jgi:DNA-binding transcriptional ArsR family regulator
MLAERGNRGGGDGALSAAARRRWIGRRGRRKSWYHLNTCSYMPLIPARDVDGLTEIFRVLGDPTRVRILDVLSRDELNVGDIANRLGVTESAVSHQLRLLRNTRIVRSRRVGRMIFYALDDRHVLGLFRQGLKHVQEGGRQAAR